MRSKFETVETLFVSNRRLYLQPVSAAENEKPISNKAHLILRFFAKDPFSPIAPVAGLLEEGLNEGLSVYDTVTRGKHTVDYDVTGRRHGSENS